MAGCNETSKYKPFGSGVILKQGDGAPTLSDYKRVSTVSLCKRDLEDKVSLPAEQPLVSIVTAVLNGAGTLQRALDSVSRQNYPSVEHIVVDGGSTDRTLHLLKEAERPSLRWISEKDRGISDAFNKGIALSRGGVVAILGADDWYEPKTVESIVRRFAETDADIVYGDLQMWERGRKGYRLNGDHRRLNRGMSLCHPALFARRRCFEEFGLFRLDFRYAMDYEWLLRARKGGARFARVESCLCNMETGGASDENWRRALLETAKARNLHVDGSGARWVSYLIAWATILKSGARRCLEAMGFGLLRRSYHKLLSGGKIHPPEV